MLQLLFQLIPLGLAGALMPSRFVAVMTLLATDRPIANAAAFWLACTLGYLVLAVLSGLVVATLVEAVQAHGRAAGLLEITLGVVLLALSARMWLRRPGASGVSPGWSRRLGSLRPRNTAAVGLLVGMAGIRNAAVLLAAAGLVDQRGFGTPVLVACLTVVVLMFSLPMVIPMWIYLRHPEGSAGALAAARQRIDARARPISLAITTVLGVFLLVVGLLSGLT